MYGFNYDKVDNKVDLQKKLPSFLSNTNQPSILEIFTPSTINDEILLDYFKFLK